MSTEQTFRYTPEAALRRALAALERAQMELRSAAKHDRTIRRTGMFLDAARECDHAIEAGNNALEPPSGPMRLAERDQGLYEAHRPSRSNHPLPDTWRCR